MSTQSPAVISGDGDTIIYREPNGGSKMSISRANGTALRRLDLDLSVGASSPRRIALSRDGKLVAFTVGDPESLDVIGTDGRGRRTLTRPKTHDDLYDILDWSPTGTALVFQRSFINDEEIAVQRLRGAAHVLARGSVGNGPDEVRWSPAGRLIAYADRKGIWVVRPDGKGRHLVVRGANLADIAWSPSGAMIAYTLSAGYVVAIVGADGRDSRRLLEHSPGQVFSLKWSPDGRLLAIEFDQSTSRSDIWVIGADGRGLRRVATGGENGLIGWTPLAPVRPPMAAPLPNERVLDARNLATPRPVVSLSGDGSRVAVVVARTLTDCDHVVVWAPATRALTRFGSPTPCRELGHGSGPSIYDVELAGSRAAWASYFSCGNFCDYTVTTATLPRPLPVSLGATSSPDDVDFHLHGTGNLLVFNDDSRLVRIGNGRGRCQRGGRPAAGICTTLHTGADARPVDSVSRGLIAIRKSGAVTVLDMQGNVVRVFPLAAGDVAAALLDGDRLVVAHSGAIEVYDTATGAVQLHRTLPEGYGLVDVDGGIAVLQRLDTLELLRLTDGHSKTLKPGRHPVLADLEPLGLYYSFSAADGSSGRVVFIPRAELIRALA